MRGKYFSTIGDVHADANSASIVLDDKSGWSETTNKTDNMGIKEKFAIAITPEPYKSLRETGIEEDKEK